MIGFRQSYTVSRLFKLYNYKHSSGSNFSIPLFHWQFVIKISYVLGEFDLQLSVGKPGVVSFFYIRQFCMDASIKFTMHFLIKFHPCTSTNNSSISMIILKWLKYQIFSFQQDAFSFAITIAALKKYIQTCHRGKKNRKRIQWGSIQGSEIGNRVLYFTLFSLFSTTTKKTRPLLHL